MLAALGLDVLDNPLRLARRRSGCEHAPHPRRSCCTLTRKLKVADVFMGGGTTIVEGARLGMQMFGNDLNPVAWFVVKNELAPVDPDEVKRLLDHIESEVKPQIMPFYACDCPRGHKGNWRRKKTGQIMGEKFDPLALKPEERLEYEYDGPEVIYTFWAKHGPCQATECSHRTPIMSSPVVAVKTLTVKAWMDRECTKCGKTFDVERHEARMAPGALFVLAPNEKPYAMMNDAGKYVCPHCGHKYHDEAAACNGQSSAVGKAKNKSVDLTLLIHPDWLRGCGSQDADGRSLGGSVTSDAESSARWNAARAKNLKLVEVRGKLPDEVCCPDTGEKFFTDSRGGTVPRRSTFTCKEATCGLDQDVLTSIRKSGKSGPMAMYVVHGYCPTCDRNGLPYSGRFFSLPTPQAYDSAFFEWEQRRSSELTDYWPRSEVPYGFMTHHNNGGIANHGFTHWWTMFNPRQMLVLTQLLRSVMTATTASWDARLHVLGAFQQYLRNENMFCIWDISRDCMAPHFSNNNYHPKANIVENSVFAELGRGNWQSCSAAVVEGLEWCQAPWDSLPKSELERSNQELANAVTGKSVRVFLGDSVQNGQTLQCGSSSNLQELADGSYDFVITDPPFGGLLHYSELADFFYVWLRLVLKGMYADLFEAEYTPKALEAVANRARHPDDPDAFYQKILTECWREARRILKPGGILAFTFHHSEDEPWVAVLESLFEAGFYLEGAYPIRSDETKGEGAKPGTFGSQLIEYDIIHVCRKRIEEPQEVSWARLRRQIMQDVKQLREMLDQHQTAGLQEADLQVIRRGKSLEYYSKHYGKVYVEKGRDFSVREALVGINTLLDDERDTAKETPPVTAEPYTRQFLRLFADTSSLPRDQMQKFLRGTGVSPAEFQERGWCTESQKVLHVTPPLELAQKWKGQPRSGIARDFDQAMFLVGSCYPNSGIRVQDTLDSPNFNPHPAIVGILDWLTRHGGDGEVKNAALLAKQLYQRWLAVNEPKVTVQRTLFDLEEAEV